MGASDLARPARGHASVRRRTVRTRLRPYEKTYLWVSRLVIWASVLVAMFPVAWVVTASFQPGFAFFSESLIPTQFTTENYRDLLQTTDFKIWMRNSLIVSTGVSVIQVFLTATSAYAFSRMKFLGRKYGLITLLILQMFPNFMSIAAVFALMVRFNLTDSLWGLIIVLAGGNAFNTWLLKGYIDSLPREIDEAALADGATHWTIFTKIIIPLSRPMLVVLFLFTFMGTYSEFVITSAAIHDPTTYTIPLGLRLFINNQFAANWTKFAAAAVLASTPLVVLFMVLQKYVEAGLTRGAIKG